MGAKKGMQFRPLFGELAGKRPVLIAGPCSAETEAQVMATAEGLLGQGIDLFRAGIWKPRTKPGGFEGVGSAGLPWLRRVQRELGMRVTIEVANRQHVREALDSGIDVLWIGARTTVNPFSVQEIADALRGTDVPVMVKNPVNPDLDLWIGAIERLYNAGIDRLAVIHRGFSSYAKTQYRNNPQWELPLELMRLLPGLPVFCDPSHICGNTILLFDVAQKALDLNYDGVMLETHISPAQAWSDARQQVTPEAYRALIARLVLRNVITEDTPFLELMDGFRQQIDEVDKAMLGLLSRRMEIAEAIGQFKRENNITIFQLNRWSEVLERALAEGALRGLSDEFVATLFRAIHQESINHQARVMHGGGSGA